MVPGNLGTSLNVINVVTNQSLTIANSVTNTYTGSAIDTQGFRDLEIILLTPAIVAAANTPVLTATYGSLSNTATTAITSASVPVGANTTLQILDLPRVTQRYVTPVVTLGASAGANTTISVLAILSGREVPCGAAGAGGDSVAGNFMTNIAPTANTTTLEFSNTMGQRSQTNTPTSILVLPNA